MNHQTMLTSSATQLCGLLGYTDAQEVQVPDFLGRYMKVTNTHKHAQTRTNTHTNTHKHTQTHTKKTQTHTNTHKHTQTHTNIYKHQFPV